MKKKSVICVLLGLMFAVVLVSTGCSKKPETAAAAPAATAAPVAAEKESPYSAMYAEMATLSGDAALQYFNSLKGKGLSGEQILDFFINLPISQANKQVYDLYVKEGFSMYVDTLPPVNFYGNYVWNKGSGATITGPYSKLQLKLPFSDYVPLPEGPIGSDPNKRYKVGVVFHGFDHSWLINWADAAAWEASRHSNVDVTVLDAEYDNQKMASIIDQFIAEDVDGILVWPMEVAPTGPPVQRAVAAGIPTVTSDRLSGFEGTTSRVFGGFPSNGAQLGMYLVWKLAQEGSFNAKMVMLRKPLGSSADGVRTGHFLKVLSYFPGIEILGSYHDVDSKEIAFKNAESALQTYQDLDIFFGTGDHEALAAIEAIQMARRMNSRAGGKKIIVISPDDSKETMVQIRNGFMDTDVPYTPLQSDISMRVLLKILAGENVGHDVTVPNIIMVTKDGGEIFGLKTQTPDDWFEYTFGPPIK
jgi:ribose transport system substrate-binding protein